MPNGLQPMLHWYRRKKDENAQAQKDNVFPATNTPDSTDVAKAAPAAAPTAVR